MCVRARAKFPVSGIQRVGASARRENNRSEIPEALFYRRHIEGNRSFDDDEYLDTFCDTVDQDIICTHGDAVRPSGEF